MTSSQAGQPGVVPPLWRVLAGLALDYVRWTQLVPMVVAWAFLLLMVGGLLVVNFQTQSFEWIERGLATYERIVGPPADSDAAVPAGPSDAGRTTWDGDDLESLALRAWAFLALAGWLLGMAWRLLFGGRLRLPLTRKLMLVAVACAACTGAMLFAWSFGSEEFHGPPAGWLALFAGVPLFVWLVSAYSLAFSLLIDLLKKALYGGGRGAGGSDDTASQVP